MKSRDAHDKQQSSEADEALPGEEEELAVLLELVVWVVGVSSMLVVGMVDGDGVMGGRTGDDKSKDTAERPHTERQNSLMCPSADQEPQRSIRMQNNEQQLTTYIYIYIYNIYF